MLVFGAGVVQVLDGVKLTTIQSGDIKGFPTLGRTKKWKDIHWENHAGWFDGPRDTHLIRRGFSHF